MKKIKITQVKSGIDRPERQKKTLVALGLNKLNADRKSTRLNSSHLVIRMPSSA